MADNLPNSGMMTFGEHLEVLRKMLFRILAVTLVLSIAIFCFKSQVFNLLLAPQSNQFVTYRLLEKWSAAIGMDFHFPESNVMLINTELSAQFMTHVSTSLYLGVLFALPYILFELFAFISPALYDSERRYSIGLLIAIYFLFMTGVLMSYFVIFPIAFQFLGTYQVSDSISNTINLSSYISTFITLTLLLGLVFQMPVIAYFLAKFGILNVDLLTHYRKHALIIIMVIAAFITPPDLFSMVAVVLPMYLLYEISIVIARRVTPSVKMGE